MLKFSVQFIGGVSVCYFFFVKTDFLINYTLTLIILLKFAGNCIYFFDCKNNKQHWLGVFKIIRRVIILIPSFTNIENNILWT